MPIPTMRVILKASGDRIVVNARDYSPALHVEGWDEPAAPPEAEPVTQPAEAEPRARKRR